MNGGGHLRVYMFIGAIGRVYHTGAGMLNSLFTVCACVWLLPGMHALVCEHSSNTIVNDFVIPHFCK